MKNKLTKKTIYTLALLIAVVILTISFAVYVNIAAASGSKVETSLNVTSGDPSVLAGISFNIWSRENKSFGDQYYQISNIMRNTVSFDETGKPNVTSYSQVYENTYLEDYRLDYFSSGKRVDLYLTKDLELGYEIGYMSGYNAIPGFQINGFKYNKIIFERAYNTNLYNSGYLIGEDIYFTITRGDINKLITCANNDEPALCSYSLTSGIFRTDGETVENIFPIEISSDDADKRILDLKYVSQTKCLALVTVENLNETYIYIYHLETGASEKHYFAATYSLNEDTGEYDIPTSEVRMPYLFVNDNFLTVISDPVIACIETDKMTSVRRNRFKYEYDQRSIYSASGFYDDSLNCFLSKDGLFYAIHIERNTKASHIFDEYWLHINVFKEDKLVFDGYISFFQKAFTTILTISDEMPFVTEDGLGVQRWAGTY